MITGASSGLGLSHAIYLTSKGYYVIGTSRNPDLLDNSLLKTRFITDHTKYKFANKKKTEVKTEKIVAPKKIVENIETILEKIRYIEMDVTNQDSVQKAIKSIENIDVLINNAGVGYFGPIEELDIELAQKQFEINYFGQLRVLQEVIPRMREAGEGQILNTSTLGGVTCIPYQAQYSASKAAVIRLTESLRLELRPFNIKVSCLLPGDINTPFDTTTVELHARKSFKPTDINALIDHIPVSQDSPYYENSKIAWTTIVQNLIVSPPPIIVSRKVEKIMKARRPKVQYKVGSRLQVYGITAIKRFLPENWSARIVAMFYGL